MKRTLLAIAAIVAAVIVVYLPASLLRDAFARVPGVDMIDTRGTLWAGTGTLLVDGAPLGQLQWSFLGRSLLALRAEYDVTLRSSDLDLSGVLSAGTSNFAATLDGHVANSAVNRMLSAYQIRMAGDVAVDQLQMRSTYQRELEALSGELRWQGGEVLYPEARGTQRADLPPMVAVLNDAGGQAVANVFQEGSATPLLQAQTRRGGYYRLGVTKALTRLVGRPWRGSDPDHAIVLEIEEQIF